MRITKANLARVVFPAGKAEHLVYDDDISGFGVRMHPTGRKTFFVQYRLGPKQRRLTLGSADALDPDEARRRARAALGSVAQGEDPATARSDAKTQAALTFGSLVPRYLAVMEGRQRPGHHADVRRYLESHWGPLAGVALATIDRQRVAVRLGELAKASGPYATNRARAALSAFFSWAIGEGLADANPVTGTNKATDEVARDRVLTDAELALVWQCVGPGDFGAIVRLLILTACRREEVAGMAWAEIAGGLWSVPGARTKNGRPLDLALPRLALNILGTVPQRAGRDLVFGDGAGGFSGWSRAKAALDARMLAELQKAGGPKSKIAPWRLHDLRRTAATRMADLGVAPHIVEAVLNHVSGHKAGVAGIYNRSSYAAEKRAALDLWAAHVAKLVES